MIGQSKNNVQIGPADPGSQSRHIDGITAAGRSIPDRVKKEESGKEKLA